MKIDITSINARRLSSDIEMLAGGNSTTVVRRCCGDAGSKPASIYFFFRIRNMVYNEEDNTNFKEDLTMKLHWKEAKEQFTVESLKKTFKYVSMAWLILQVVGTVIYFING